MIDDNVARVDSPDWADWLATWPVAHRGLHDAQHPENSLKAFEQACNNSFSIELDVRVSEDRKLVVFHDTNVRQADGSHEKVSNLSAQQLARYGEGTTGAEVVQLEEVFEVIAGRVPIVISVKGWRRIMTLGNLVVAAVEDYSGVAGVSSVNPLLAYYLHWRRLPAPIGLLSSSMLGRNLIVRFLGQLYRSIVVIVPWVRPQFLSMDLGSLNESMVAALHKKNCAVLAWTITRRIDLAKVERLNVNYMFELTGDLALDDIPGHQRRRTV